MTRAALPWNARLRHGALLLLIALRAEAQPPTPPAAVSIAPPAGPGSAATAAGSPPPGPAPAQAAAPSAPAAGASSGGAPVAAVDPVEEASLAFQRGDALFQRGEYNAALGEYERAYEWLPVYNVLYNIGAANVRLSRWAAARRALAAYLELGGSEVSPERAREVRSLLDVLRQKTATLSLLLNVSDAEVHVDGVRVAPTEISGLVIEPGEHVVRVTKPGFRPLAQVLRATTGEDVRVVLPLTRSSTLGPAAPIALTVAPAPPVPVDAEPAPLWIPWALTGVLAAGWLTTGALAIQARHDRDAIEQPGTPQHRIDSARRLHISLAVASDVLLAATLVSGGISAYMTWWPSDSAAGAGLGPAPIGGVGAGVSGHF